MDFLILNKNNHRKGEKQTVHFLFQFSKEQKEALQKGELTGVAIPFGQPTSDWRKASFKKGSVASGKVPLFINHESYDVKSMIGVTTLIAGNKSLDFKARMNVKDPMVTEKIIPLIDMGALEGVSVGAYILAKEDKYDDDGNRIETIITEAEVYELSVVTFQAFEDAKIKANKKENQMGLKKDKQGKEVLELGEETQETENKPISAGENASSEEDEGEELETTSEDEGESDNEEVEETEEGETEETEEGETEETEEASQGLEGIEFSEENFKTIQKANIELKKENEELKKNKNDTAKKQVIKELIVSGKLHKSQEERVMNLFSTDEAIKEFYKDIPASFSVKPKGDGSPDVTTEQVNKELHAKLSKQVSGLSEEDFEKYGK